MIALETEEDKSTKLQELQEKLGVHLQKEWMCEYYDKTREVRPY